jgi:hypothetical protein
MTEEPIKVQPIQAMKFRLACLNEEYRKMNDWVYKKRFDKLKDKRVYIVNQHTRNYWEKVRFIQLETIGLLENVITFLEAFEEAV